MTYEHKKDLRPSALLRNARVSSRKARYIFGRAEDFTITSLPPRVTIKKFANKTIKLIGCGDYYLAEEQKKGYR